MQTRAIAAASLLGFARSSGASPSPSPSLQGVKHFQGTLSPTSVPVDKFSPMAEKQCTFLYTLCLNDSRVLTDPNYVDQCTEGFDDCLAGAGVIEPSPGNDEAQCDLDYVRCRNDSQTLIYPELANQCVEDYNQCLADAALTTPSPEPSEQVSQAFKPSPTAKLSGLALATSLAASIAMR